VVKPTVEPFLIVCWPGTESDVAGSALSSESLSMELFDDQDNTQLHCLSLFDFFTLSLLFYLAPFGSLG